VTLTTAPGIAAPEGSVTCPRRFATFCAKAADTANEASVHTKSIFRIVVILFLSLVFCTTVPVSPRTALLSKSAESAEVAADVPITQRQLCRAGLG